MTSTCSSKRMDRGNRCCFCMVVAVVTRIGIMQGEEFVREHKLIVPDARGHGRSTNPARTISHRQCAFDTLAMLDHLNIERYLAIGISMGGNILLHMATMQPERIESMVD